MIVRLLSSGKCKELSERWTMGIARFGFDMSILFFGGVGMG